MSFVSFNFVTFVLLLGGVFYLWMKYVFGYWSRRGVPYVEPSFPFGNFGALFRRKKAIGKVIGELRNAKNVPLLGMYMSFSPMLLVNDPELAKTILIKDFQYFHDRGAFVDEEIDPLSGVLFKLSGEKWKNMRAKLTPTFTSGKLKGMFQTLLDVGVTLQNYVEKFALKEETLEIRDLMARYNTNIIASIAFGLDVDTINEPNHIFRVMGRKIFAQDIKSNIRFALGILFSNLNKYLKIKSFDPAIERFMIDLVKETIEYREKNNVVRKDFMQLMIQLRNTGTVSIDERWDIEATDSTSKKQLSINEVAAQAFVFFVAGFETSSSAMSFCLFEMCKNLEIQHKLQKEIDDVTARFEGKITYDSIMEMKYLDNCLDETLRLHPPTPFLIRECKQDYTFPKTSTTIEKGTQIIMPFTAFQTDSKYFYDPLKFIPERFHDEEIKTKPYAPFGDGPRNCIGTRLAKMLSKVGLVTMLSNYNFELGKDMPEEIEIDPRILIQTPICGINLKVSKR